MKERQVTKANKITALEVVRDVAQGTWLALFWLSIGAGNPTRWGLIALFVAVAVAASIARARLIYS